MEKISGTFTFAKFSKRDCDLLSQYLGHCAGMQPMVK